MRGDFALLSGDVLRTPLHDPIGVQFFAVRSFHILNRVALAQCASCDERIVPRRQQSGAFYFGIAILEVTNVPALRFAHFPLRSQSLGKPSATFRRAEAAQEGITAGGRW